MTRQLEVDQVLRSWLSEGAEHAPERHLMSAIERIEAMPQRRPLISPRIGATPSLPRLALGMMLVILLAALGIGLGMQIGLIRLPGPQPAPTPGPDRRDARNVELFSNPGDGYELLLPAEWQEVSVPHVDGQPAAGMRRFRAPSLSFRALTISVGEPNGTVRVCDPSCREAEGQVSLDILQETLVSSPEVAGWRQVHGDAVIGGEAARFERPNTGATIWSGGLPTFYHFFGLHDGRPIVLSFDYWPIRREAINTDTMHRIVESFRFLNPSADAADEGSLVTLSDPRNGYELTIPAGWVDVQPPSLDGAPAHGVRRFESGTDHPYGALTISIGQPDGTLVVCHPDCEVADGIESVADLRTAIHDLEQVVHETPYGPIELHTPSGVVRGAVTLGGEAAEFQRPQAVMDRGGAAYHVYAIHDGRPVLVSFGLRSYARVGEIIESFRFTD